jgi:hypothetical protein
MIRLVLPLAAEFLSLCILQGLALGQLPQPLPKLNYNVITDFFQLPPEEHLVEPAGVAVNSKGHIYVFHRGRPFRTVQAAAHRSKKRMSTPA